MADQVYDGFISYSHAADGLLAPRLQAGLQRFAKPWWKRRAVRIFRDESSLSANPHLWSSITEALDSSGWFVLLLSPDAAQSGWVNQEIDYWKQHKDPARILPVLTDGTFGWMDGDVTGDAVPQQLKGVFAEEPRWVDLRFAKGEEQLDLKNARFAAVVADIASALRGVPKDELESEEVRHHRRTVRTAWAAVGLVTVLAIAAIGFGIQSNRNASEAERQSEIALHNEQLALQNEQRAEGNAVEAETQRMAAESSEAEAVVQAAIARSRELGASAVEALDSRKDPKLAALLALESLHVGGPLGEQPTTIVDTLFKAVSTDRLVDIIETGTQGRVHIAMSPDDIQLIASSEDSGWVRMYSVPDGSLLWEFTEDTSDTFTLVHFHPDGTRVAVGVADSEAYDRRLMNPDGLPARILILDATTGEEIRRLSSAPCTAVDPWGWSPDGRLFVVASGLATCERPGTTAGTWAEMLDGDTFEPLRLFDVTDPMFGVRANFTDSGDLFLHGFETPTVVYRAPDYDAPEQIDNTNGFNAPSPDGRLVTSFGPGSPERFTLVDVESGQRIDVLRPLTSNPALPQGVILSPDGSQVIAQTEGEGTLIWDVFSGQQLFVLPARGRGNPVMTADGQSLYTSHADGQIRAWTLQPITIGQTVVGDLEGFDWVNANKFTVGPSLGAAEAFRFGEDIEGKTVFFDPESGTIDHVLEGFVTPGALADGRFAVWEMDGGGEWVYDPVTGDLEHLAECKTSNTEPPFLCDDTGEEKIFVSRIISLDRSQILYVHHTFDVSETAPPFYEIVDAASLKVIESGSWAFDTFDPVLTFTDEWIAGYTTAFSKLVVVDRTTGDEIARSLCECREEISPSGRIYAGIEEARLTFADIPGWESRTYDLGLGSIRGMAFSPDDSVLLLGAAEEILFVDLEQGEIFRRLPVPDISDFHWIDDQTVLIGNREGLWATLTLDPFELADATLANLTRGFEPDECDTYAIDPCPSSLESVRERYGRLGR